MAGFKGFFADYDARADAPLARPVARRWATMFAALVGGTLDVTSQARALHATPPGGEPTNGEEFAAMVAGELASTSRSAETFGQVGRKLGLAEAKPLTRGNACRWLYQAIPRLYAQSSAREVE